MNGSKNNPQLFANGCSFTDALDLPNPTQDRWSAIVARELELADINIGLGGSSNDRIFRTTMEWFNVNQVPELVILGWTHTERSELIYHKGMYLRLNPRRCLADHNDMCDDLEPVHKFYFSHMHNEFILFRNWVHRILHLQSFFELHKIKYRFFQALGTNWIQEFLNETDLALAFADTAWQWRDKTTMPAFKNGHPEYTEMLNLVNRICFDNWILHGNETMCEHLNKLNCDKDASGHFLDQGHKKWAELILVDL